MKRAIGFGLGVVLGLTAITLVFLLGWSCGHQSDIVTVPSASNRTAPSSVWSFEDSRFRYVSFREDELLDTPLLAEVYRLARIRLTQDKDLSPHDFYEKLSGQGIVVVTRKEGTTTTHSVLIGRTRHIDKDTVLAWKFPDITQTFEQSSSRTVLTSREPFVRMLFSDFGGRFVLTDFWDMPSEAAGESSESLGTVQSVTFYERNTDTLASLTTERLVERMQHVKELLARLQLQAAMASPEAPQLRREVQLNWLATDTGRNGEAWTDSKGQPHMNVALETAVTWSDTHLSWLLGHELGHIARPHHVECADSSASPCQVGANAFALKLMGADAYRRAKTIAEAGDEKKINEEIAKLETVNSNFPGY